ncbi:MAG: glucosyl-dolichyl phosphate glucuronosyltransferase, partial [Halobacteriales archaeon]|nr:glucosyl-dolichyl phosphate glucuronosyltransferase [Halobacteriales archaeon]
MKVSVVICTYSMERYDVFCECLESVLAQTHAPLEVVVVVDGNQPLFDRVREEFDTDEVQPLVDDLHIHGHDDTRGISYSRTKGAVLASGEIVAFIDDDAVAEPDWIDELVGVYESTDAIAVGGQVAPDWVTEKPDFFPDEFYWLIGCDERDFADDGEELRNTYGSNISYRREAFLQVGGYDTNTGRKGDRHVQAHEAPVGVRLLAEFGQGVLYCETAVVHHRLFDYRGDFRWLVKRAFLQGFSKRIFNVLYPDAPNSEGAFLRALLFQWVPARLGELLRRPTVSKLKQLGAIVVFTAAVGVGYLYGLTKRTGSLV